MKIKHAVLVVTVAAVLALANGCGKEAPPTGETPKATAEPVPAAEAVKAVTEATSEAQKAVEAPKAAAEQAAAAAAEAAQAAATQAVAAATAAAAPAAMSAQVQGLIDQAKGLVTNQKYQEALTVVQELSNLKLTPEQQKLVDGLKAQIQTALTKAATTDPASAVGNVLGGKK